MAQRYFIVTGCIFILTKTPFQELEASIEKGELLALANVLKGKNAVEILKGKILFGRLSGERLTSYWRFGHTAAIPFDHWRVPQPLTKHC